MEYKSTLQKAKDILKKTAIAYVVLGSFYMAGANVTGHPSADHYLARNPIVQEAIQKRETTGHLSADIFLGKAKPTKLESLLLDAPRG
jgi:hypothetical protein